MMMVAMLRAGAGGSGGGTGDGNASGEGGGGAAVKVGTAAVVRAAQVDAKAAGGQRGKISRKG